LRETCRRLSREVAVGVRTLLAAAAIVACAPAARAQFPDGPGKALVEQACLSCHEPARIRNSGYNRADWQNVVHMMLNVGAPVPPDQVPLLTDYLASHFPEKPRPTPSLLEGSAKVEFREWVVPTPGSRPHDPLASPDGSIWYTGHMANVLGRLDPRTGHITEYHPDIPSSGPHGLVADKDGNIWFTGNFAGYIGKLDPHTGTFTSYQLPDPAARDPHTPLFDRRGILWFTVQGANMLGRLDPKSGEIRLVRSPTPRSNPYGMVIDSHDVPWFCEFGSNKLASIDPDTMAIHEHGLPNPASRPRRIAITPDDVIWYSDYARGHLGRFDIKTGEVKEYASPGGPNSQPYGIVWLKRAVWYSESGVRPNTLVRFDPATETFQSWAIPSGGGVVRNMMVTRDGNIAMAESGVNRVALALVE
jgi:virginiamycin B lyase